MLGNSMGDITLSARIRAMDWLLKAVAPWLLQGEGKGRHIPIHAAGDWEAVEDLAYFHNIEPILHWLVSNKQLSTRIPANLKQRWEKAYFENFLRNERFFETLKTLLDFCESHEIPVVVLKGPALIGRVYKDSALRTLSDIDIFCAQNDLQRIVAIGKDMGYELAIRGDTPAFIYHMAMTHPDSGMILEFHFAPYEIIRNPDAFLAMAWDRREWIDIGGITCPVLSPEMELAFNIAHLCQHHFDISLKHYIDIAGLIIFCRDELDGDEVNKVMRDFGKVMRDFGLGPLSDLVMGFVSDRMLRSQVTGLTLSDRRTSVQESFNSSLLRLLALLDKDRLVNINGYMWNLRIALKNRESWREKISYIMIKMIFPFLGSREAYQGVRPSGVTIMYYIDHLLFYYKRLLQTLTNRANKSGHKKPVIARAAAKKDISRILLKQRRS